MCLTQRVDPKTGWKGTSDPISQFPPTINKYTPKYVVIEVPFDSPSPEQTGDNIGDESEGKAGNKNGTKKLGSFVRNESAKGWSAQRLPLIKVFYFIEMSPFFQTYGAKDLGNVSKAKEKS